MAPHVWNQLKATHRRLLHSRTQLDLPDALRAKWTAPHAGPFVDEQTLRYYEANGYTSGQQFLDDEDLTFLQENFRRLAEDFGGWDPANSRQWHLQNWHLYNDWIFHLLSHSRVLDGAEQILGPDIVLWGSAFYVKPPGDQRIIPWHQDGAMWEPALSPMEAVTVFIPFFDVDRGNACMQMIPGSHLGAEWLVTQRRDRDEVIFGQHTSPSEIDESKIVHAEMEAGEAMFHHPAVLHRSLDNPSDRLKAVITARLCTPAVKCDLQEWMDFKSLLVRGTDGYGHNPVATPPRQRKNSWPGRRNRYAPAKPPRAGRWRMRDPNFLTREVPDSQPRPRAE